MKYNVAVFSYDSLHRKTYDILISLYLSGVDNVLVVAAPLVKLKGVNTDKLFTPITYGEYEHPKDICKRFNYQYIVCPHDNFPKLKGIFNTHGTNIAIISGARILRKDIVSLMEYGVINYHPGALPETSGLDSLYWMLENSVKPSVTCHFIDHKVDAGFLIKEQNVEINNSDTIEIVVHKMYISQIVLHKYICHNIVKGNEFEVTPILRLKKNKQMNNSQKLNALSKFVLWKDIYASN